MSTHEEILSNIDNKFDKSDGSFTYDITKAVAVAIEGLSVETDSVIEKLNVDNLTGSELTRFVYQRAGITRRPSTFANGMVLLTGAPSTVVPIGSLVAADDVFYSTVEGVTLDGSGRGYVKVQCQIDGQIGNVPVGAINSFPVTISGVMTVTNEQAFTNGYVAESDNELRQRYYDKLQRPGKAGNAFHYEEWAKSVIGVGNVKVYPLWDGALTVKVLLMDINNELPSTELLTNVYNYIESERPFGAIVTVDKPSTVDISIKVNIMIAADYILADVTTMLENNLNAFIKSLAFTADHVSIAQIGRIILETPGVIDYTELTLNNGAANIEIPDGSVPISGGLNANAV